MGTNRIARVSRASGSAQGGEPASPPLPRLWERGQRWILGVLVAILLLAGLLRGLYLAELVGNPMFGDPAVDGQYHDYWARGLATGNWTPPENCRDPLIRTTPFLRPPGYPYFLAMVYRLLGPSHVGAVIVQMGLGILSCVVGFCFARRWFGNATALVFALFLAVYWIFIYYEGELLEPVLLELLGLLFVFALSTWTARMTFRRGLLAGALVGLFALCRPNVLLFGAPALLWALWVARRRGNWRTCGRAAGGLIGGAGLVVAPAAIRNYAVSRDYVLISANGGVNLWIGNNDRANGTFVEAPGIESFNTCFDYPAIVHAVERKLGRPLRYSEVSSFFAGQAWDWIKANPSLELKLLGYKTLVFWGPVEVHHNTVEAAERANSTVLSGTLLTFPLVFSLFLIGAAMFVLDRHRGLPRAVGLGAAAEGQVEVFILVLLFLLTYFVSFLPFFVVAQYRAPMVPFLLLMAAYAVVRFGLMVRAAEFRQFLLWAPVCAIVAALASTDFSSHKVDFAKWHCDRGGSLFKQGRIDEAIDEYAEAVRLSTNYPQAHVALGTALARKGNYAGALAAYRKALELKPDDARTYLSLGLALEGANRPDEAIQAYRAAVRCAPDYAEAYVNLGAVLQDRRRLDEAIQAYRQAAQIAPDMGFAHRNLAIVLFLRGQYPEAWEAVFQARRCGADLPQSFLKALAEKMPEPSGGPSSSHSDAGHRSGGKGVSQKNPRLAQGRAILRGSAIAVAGHSRLQIRAHNVRPGDAVERPDSEGTL